jgi:S-formylglutathione hydrolase FrmB
MKAGAHHTAQRLLEAGTIKPMLIAMPSDGLLGDGSGYIVQAGNDYEQWIVEDVPKAVLEATNLASEQSPIFLAGLSMGGFGALRLGAKYGQQLSGISGHSSITCWDEMALFVEEDIAIVNIPKKEKNVIDVILEHQNNLPPLRFDCGQEDPLIEGNRKLHQQLLDRDIKHQYEEFTGGHEWPYWETHLVDTLTFFNGLLKES